MTSLAWTTLSTELWWPRPSLSLVPSLVLHALAVLSAMRNKNHANRSTKTSIKQIAEASRDDRVKSTQQEW